MLNELWIWCALAAGLVLLIVDRRRKNGALTLAYFLTLSVGHVPGVLAYLDPDAIMPSAEATKVGFDTTLIGMSAFLVGAGVARLLPQRTTDGEVRQHSASNDPFSRLGWRMLMIGVVTQFLLMPVASLLPSLSAITAVSGLIIILGFWLRLYGSEGMQTLSLVAMMTLLPLSTLATGGFLGFGTIWALTAVAFCFVIAKRRIWFYLATPAVVFLGLSLFVTYFQQRDDIRNVVWDQNTGLIERLDRVFSLVTDFQFLDLSNEWHQYALDERLNQNYLVGLGVMRHREYGTELMYGSTVPIWALIPRAIWPDKPDVGGGGDLVSKFTGVAFAEGTSVGTGQVLEFYMNFGMLGVIGGFAILGFVLKWLDQQMMRAFALQKTRNVVLIALPGLAMVSPLGNLLEILVSVVSAIIVSRLLFYMNLLSLPSTRKTNAKMSGRAIRAIARR
jgi:hypothetical protein